MAYIYAIHLSSDIILCRLKTIETFSYFSIIIIISIIIISIIIISIIIIIIIISIIIIIIIIIIVMIDIIIYLFNITFLSTINRSLWITISDPTRSFLTSGCA